ncbi:MAG: hypothetical protein ACRDVE_13880, partial [Actinocrinis sp.]
MTDESELDEDLSAAAPDEGGAVEQGPVEQGTVEQAGVEHGALERGADQDARDGLALRARGGIRAWIETHGAGLRRSTPILFVVGLTAAALVPVAAPLLVGASTGAAAGLINQLGNVGAEHIARLAQNLVARQRRREHGPDGDGAAAPGLLAGEGAQDVLRVLLEQHLQHELDGPDAELFEAEMAHFLHEVDGVGTALDAAFHSGVDGLYDHLGRAIHELGESSAAFRVFFEDVKAQLSVIQRGTARIEAAQRGQTEQIEKMNMRLALLYRLYATDRPGPRTAPAGRSSAPEGLGVTARAVLAMGELSVSDPSAERRDEHPYPGLAAFGESDAEWFNGRDGSIAELVTGLRQRLERPSALIVVGASGAGKSSLLRAGLLPSLATGALAVSGSARWPCEMMTPGREPLRELALRLAARTGVPAAAMHRDLQDDPLAAPTLIRQALRAQLADQQPDTSGIAALDDDDGEGDG